MDNIPQQIALAAAIIFLALWIVRELMTIRKRGKLDKICGLLALINEKLEKQGRQTEDLHEWHDVKDNEGVRLWYVRRSLEDAIKELATNIGRQTEIFQAMASEIKLMSQKVNSVRKT